MKWAALITIAFLAACGSESSKVEIDQVESALEREHDMDTVEFDPIWRGERLVDIQLQASPAYTDGDVQKFWETTGTAPPVQTGRWVRVAMSHVLSSSPGLTSGYVANSITVIETYEP